MNGVSSMSPNYRALIPACLLVLAILLTGPALRAENTPPENTADEYVSIDFDNVDIKVFIKFISKLTRKNFVVDSRVKGKVTVISPTKISVKEAYQVFVSVLEIHGFSTVQSGAVTKVITSPSARADNVDTRISTFPETTSDRLVTRLIPLDYADTDELKRLFTPLLPKGSVVLSYKDTNMLIITASLSSIERILKIIRSIDVPSIGKKISVIPVEHADASKLTRTLSAVFKARVKTAKSKKNTTTDMVTFTADERTNSIILLASKVETDRAAELIKLLDQQVPRGEERIRVYYLEHALAEDLAKVLQSIPTQKDSKATATGKKTTAILSQKVNINADTATNALIIMAEKEDYPVLEEVIAKLDIPRSMVYIECLIMEVNVNRGLDIGTEWQTTQSYSNGDRGVTSGFSGTGDYANPSDLLSQGFSLGIIGKTITIGDYTFPDISAVVDAYQSDDDVTILSTPQILTTENEEATITVGSNIPYQTRSTTTEDGYDTYQSYEYKDVGITLKITPRISQGRMIRMDVFQELTKLTNVNQDGDNDRPTTLKRQIETNIIVEDGNSVVIGGLIDENLSQSTSKTPCLGDIPVLGWAFKSVNEGEDKTNLYIFLTPRVIKSPLEATELYNNKKNDINNAIKKGEIRLFDKVDKAGKILSGQGWTEDQDQPDLKETP